jgi:tRNA(Ile)-lysidine synthase
MPDRPRLSPAIADVRRAVRASLAPLLPDRNSLPADRNPLPADRNPLPAGRNPLPAYRNSWDESQHADPTAAARRAEASDHELRKGGAPLVLVALSGGPDSLALAAATAFEAPRAGLRAGAVIVDHGLQPGSADAAANAAAQATALGLDPVRLEHVVVGAEGGPEAAARAARYAALTRVAAETGAVAVLLGHTLDDQAETVLLGLARGSGATSLTGMDRVAGLYRRPLLGIRRSTTVQCCVDSGLEPWLDPQNDDGAFARVRVRRRVLPVMEEELGPGIAEALARTADQLREDADALDHFAHEIVEDLAEHSEAGISLPVAALAAQPPALRQRLIRLAVASEFHASLSRAHTLEVARLITDWHGQGPVDVPGVRVERHDGLLLFTAKD